MNLIDKAYILINEPVNPNLKCPEILADCADFIEAEPGEDVQYFASPGMDREDAGIYAADAAGTLTYHKIGLKTVTTLSFSGLQSKMETILLDEVLNSKDQKAIAQVKDNIEKNMTAKEVQNLLNLVLAVASQECTKDTGEDLLDVVIKLKQKVASYCSDYILLVAPDVMDAVEVYDKSNVATFNYKMNIMEEIKKLGINKIVKVVGDSNYNGSATAILGAGKAILIGRYSSIQSNGRPLTLCRRKFSKLVAELSGAKEGASRLVDIARIPLVAGHELSYGIYGYESVIQCLTNYRAVSWSTDIIS